MDFSFFDFDQYAITETSNPLIIGDHKATTVIVTYDADFNEYNELISKIFKAVNIDLANQAMIVQLKENQEINLASHLTDGTQKIFVFGINPKLLGLNASFKAYREYKTEDFYIVFSHALKDLSTQTNFKKALWTVLQESFNI